MDPQKRLKLIPLHQFFKVMDRPGKWMYLVLYLALLGAVAGMLLGVTDPSRWVLEMKEVHDSSIEEVQLREYTHNYRTMHTEIGAWKEKVSYYATPMRPKAWIVYAFVALQILGWAYLLTAASYVRNFVAYVIYFLFAMAIFLSGAFELVAPGMKWVFNIALAALIFVPAYLFQQNIWNFRFALRLPLFAALITIPFAVAYGANGWVGLHGVTVGMFPLLAFMVIIYFVFLSKDISQALFFSVTNLPNRNLRPTFPVILGLFLVITALEVLMVQDAMGWELIPMKDKFPLRPVYMIALAVVLMPGLNQNIAYVARSGIDNRAFTTLITAFGLLCVSAIAYHAALGEYFYALTFERLAAILFLIAGLLHFFYMYYNFGPMLRARMNFYFLSMSPKRLMYAFVVAATVLISLALEASQGMKTERLLKSTYLGRNADHEWLQDSLPQALTLYGAAVETATGTVKGNYNKAMLILQMNGDLAEARTCLRRAPRTTPFAPAWVNLGNLELGLGTIQQAKYFLKQGMAEARSPYIANNLAQAYLMLDEPDSAVLMMKEALRMAPDQPTLYANMGRIYLDYDKAGPAEDFLAAGLQFPNPGPAVVTNALFLNMKHGTSLHVPDSLLSLPGLAESRGTAFNFALERYKTKDYAGASRILDTLLAFGESPDALLLDGMLRFEQGKVEEAVSRMQYIDPNYPDYRKYTSHFLGVAFFSAGVPEMAAAHFRNSVQNGRMDDQLQVALMEIDRGDHDKGFAELLAARERDTSLFDAVAREEAMLQLSRGEYFFASIGFDFGHLSREDWVRTGIYAGQKGHRGPALEAFRRALELDSTWVAPYLEMGRISLALGDTLAKENLLPGLRNNPGHIPLRVELARAEWMLGNRDAALRLAADLAKAAPDSLPVRELQAEFAAYQGDTAQAAERYTALHKDYPLNQRILVGLSRMLRAQGKIYEGQNLVYNALGINTRNPALWLEMALFERALARLEQAGDAAIKAADLETDPAKAALIRTEFAAEIAAYRTMYQPEE